MFYYGISPNSVCRIIIQTSIASLKNRKQKYLNELLHGILLLHERNFLVAILYSLYHCNLKNTWKTLQHTL